MSNEDLVRELKAHNTELMKAVLESNNKPQLKKENDWKTNPVTYIVVMVLLSLLVNAKESR